MYGIFDDLTNRTFKTLYLRRVFTLLSKKCNDSCRFAAPRKNSPALCERGIFVISYISIRSIYQIITIS